MADGARPLWAQTAAIEGAGMIGKDLAILSGFVVILSCGQLLFKTTAAALAGAVGTADALARLLAAPSFYAAVGLYGFSTLLWIWILTRMPLSLAYPWVALTTAVVPLLAILVHGEKVRPVFWLGLVLVVLGILLIQQAAGRS